MKVALPSRENQIDSHFGHCDYFTVFTIDETTKKILSQEKLKSPQGCGCKSNVAQLLAEMGVTTMLAGNMGEGAVNVLNHAGIEVYRGCSGRVEQVVQQWLDGSLTDSGDACHEHEHGCHGHEH